MHVTSAFPSFVLCVCAEFIVTMNATFQLAQSAILSALSIVSFQNATQFKSALENCEKRIESRAVSIRTIVIYLSSIQIY